MKIKIIIFVLLSALLWAVLGYALLADENLSEDSKFLLNIPQANINNPAYYYLMGIDVAAEDDPIEQGKILFDRIENGSRELNQKGVDFEYVDYPKDKRVKLDSPLLCTYREEECLKLITDQSDSFDERLPNNLLANTRYEQYLTYGNYQTLHEISDKIPFPPYWFLVKANRIFLIQQLKIAKHGNPIIAAEHIFERIKLLRQELTAADTLVGKMVFVAQISESINILSLISSKYGRKSYPHLSTLTISEKTLDLPLKNEFKLIYLILSRDPAQLFNDPKNTNNKIPTAIIRLLFKRNMTLNLFAIDSNHQLTNSKLTPAEFVEQEARRKNSNEKSSQFSLRNIFGNKLSVISNPNYGKYIARIYDLDVKISLLNKYLQREEGTNEIRIYNPYLEQQETIALEKPKLCATGPYEDESNVRCIFIQ